MTREAWLFYARVNQEKLEHFLSNWHPINQKPYGDMTITAKNAEKACENVREQIRDEVKEDPVVTFRRALASSQIVPIDKVLNEAWFGVPESTDCWQIKGFKEAVTLIEDLPE